MIEVLGDYKLVFFALGTAGFLVTLYLSVKHPALVKPAQTAPEDVQASAAAASAEAAGDLGDSRKWDDIATWVMWGGWAIFGVITVLQSMEKNLGFMQ